MACLQRCSIIDKVKLREIDVSEAKWVRQHENENARLTTLFADPPLQNGHHQTLKNGFTDGSWEIALTVCLQDLNNMHSYVGYMGLCLVRGSSR